MFKLYLLLTLYPKHEDELYVTKVSMFSDKTSKVTSGLVVTSIKQPPALSSQTSSFLTLILIFTSQKQPLASLCFPLVAAYTGLTI